VGFPVIGLAHGAKTTRQHASLMVDEEAACQSEAALHKDAQADWPQWEELRCEWDSANQKCTAPGYEKIPFTGSSIPFLLTCGQGFDQCAQPKQPDFFEWPAKNTTISRNAIVESDGRLQPHLREDFVKTFNSFMTEKNWRTEEVEVLDGRKVPWADFFKLTFEDAHMTDKPAPVGQMQAGKDIQWSDRFPVRIQKRPDCPPCPRPEVRVLIADGAGCSAAKQAVPFKGNTLVKWELPEDSGLTKESTLKDWTALLGQSPSRGTWRDHTKKVKLLDGPCQPSEGLTACGGTVHKVTNFSLGVKDAVLGFFGSSDGQSDKSAEQLPEASADDVNSVDWFLEKPEQQPAASAEKRCRANATGLERGTGSELDKKLYWLKVECTCT